jgi:hypothetical protein
MFEMALATRLREMQGSLASMSDLFRGVNPGKVWIRPKAIEQTSGEPVGRSVVVIPNFAHDHQIASMSVRVLLEPSPIFATTEVIWLRAFGPALDALLQRACRGNRLHLQGTPPAVPLSGRRVYRYWAPEYRRFRDGAIQAAKSALANSPSGRCILTTLDLTSYYDNIDASFLVAPEFVAEVVTEATKSGTPFDPGEYVAATSGLLEAFARFWSSVRTAIGGTRKIGLPIGALTSRLIANLALRELDRLVASQPAVKYYARYVDDLIVVEQPDLSETFSARETVRRLMPLDPIRTTNSRYVLDSARLRRPGSSFIVQPSKLRVFDLNGEQGLEYLGAVEAEMQRVSSQRLRFLEPWGEELDHTVMASRNAESVRVLREADSLSLRKLAVGTVSDKVATAAAMLNQDDARRFSRTYLGKAGRLSTDWSRWVDLIDVSLRILGSALMSGDTETASEIVTAILERVASLDGGGAASFKISWGGIRLPSARAERAVRKLRDWVEEQLVETICASTPFSTHGFMVSDMRLLADGLRLRDGTLDTEALLTTATLLAAADLRLADAETDHAMGIPRVKRPADEIGELETELRGDAEYLVRAAGLHAFLAAAVDAHDDVYSGLSAVELLLMSRPPSYGDVLFRWLRAERPLAGLVDVVNGVRGTRYATVPMTETQSEVTVAPPSDVLDPRNEVGVTRVVLGNLSAPETWWVQSLSAPVHTIERQARLARVLNHAMYAARFSRERPTLLVLPELSLPRRWVRQVCLHLNRTAPVLALVAGIEYDVVGTKVFNESIAYLPRPFHSAAGWIWTKRRAAYHEDIALRKLNFAFGVRGASRRFTVMRSEHGAFIPLICSELLEVDTRAELRGAIDLLLVPSWNQDTASFEHLVHSTALELHSFVAVSNNGFYSDCRVRAPYAEGWKREVCRLIARNQNEVVFADLEIGRLRAFQQDPERPPENVRWKPLPPGYVWRKG